VQQYIITCFLAYTSLVGDREATTVALNTLLVRT